MHRRSASSHFLSDTGEESDESVTVNAANARLLLQSYRIVAFSTGRCYHYKQRGQVLLSLGSMVAKFEMLCREAEHFCISGGNIMAVSYKKLWKLLIDKDMKKKDLCAKAGISPASVTKLGRNGHVTTEILLKICTALDCQIEDIMEIVPDKQS